MACSVPEYWHQFSDLADPASVHTTRLRMSDGFELIAYEMGSSHARRLVIVNPIHVPFLAMYRVAQQLARSFRVISYEIRGSAFLAEYPAIDNTGLERQSLDLCEIAAHLGSDATHFLGWCNGARAIAYACGIQQLSAATATLISPSGTGAPIGKHTERTTLFGALDCLTEVQVERVRRILAEAFSAPASAATPDTELMQKLFGLNFCAPERFRQYVRAKLRRYSQLPQDYSALATFDALCQRSAVLLICPERDTFMESDKISLALQRNPSVRCVQISGAEHAPLLSHSVSIAAATIDFILKHV